ncbi:hypothetical protein, partial [Thiorhodococcus mannitoliphagus]
EWFNRGPGGPWDFSGGYACLREGRNSLSAAIMTRERIAESIKALAKVGGPGDLRVLNSVFGEHEAAAKAAIAEIEARH